MTQVPPPGAYPPPSAYPPPGYSAPGYPLEAAQREVALASLDSAHVRPVNTHDLGKCFLAEIVRLPVSPEISAKGPLKLALHK